MPDFLTIDNVYKGISALSAIGAGILGWLVLRLRAEFPSRADLTDVKKQLSDLTARTADIEREQTELRAVVSAMPTQADLNRITEKLGALSGDVKALETRVGDGLSGVREQLSMLMQHHLERGA
jgi:hypothetical protein